MDSDCVENREEQFRAWGFWATVGFCLFMAGVGVGVVVLLSGMDGLLRLRGNGLGFSINLIIVDSVIIALCILFAHLRKGISIPEYLGFKRAKSNQMFTWCGITIAVVVCIEFFELAIGDLTNRNNFMPMFETAVYWPLLWLASVVFAPVMEEIFFRGFVFKGFREALGQSWAVILLSFIFAILHQHHSFIGIIMVFIMGVLFCVARIRAGSVYVPIAMHMVTNLIGMLHVLYWFVHEY